MKITTRRRQRSSGIENQKRRPQKGNRQNQSDQQPHRPARNPPENQCRLRILPLHPASTDGFTYSRLVIPLPTFPPIENLCVHSYPARRLLNRMRSGKKASHRQSQNWKLRIGIGGKMRTEQLLSSRMHGGGEKDVHHHAHRQQRTCDVNEAETVAVSTPTIVPLPSFVPRNGPTDAAFQCPWARFPSFFNELFHGASFSLISVINQIKK